MPLKGDLSVMLASIALFTSALSPVSSAQSNCHPSCIVTPDLQVVTCQCLTEFAALESLLNSTVSHSVKNLTLTSCNINAVESNDLKDFVNVHHLAITHCHLISVGMSAFSELESMESLDLSWNSISKVEENWLDETPASLTSVNLAGNPITHLRYNTFVLAPYIQQIDLSNCSIASIDNYAFSPLTNLEHVNLDSNDLMVISEAALNSTSTRMVTVSAAHNPWHCNCSLKWIYENQPQSAKVVNSECRSPPELAGKRLNESYACIDETILVGNVSESSSGAIAGIIIAVIVVILLIVAGVYLYHRCKRQTKSGSSQRYSAVYKETVEHKQGV